MIQRLIILLLVVAAVYYGWKNYGSLMSSMNRKSGDVVLVNHSGSAVERVRISTGGQTTVVESLEDGATARVDFQPESEGTFSVVWMYRSRMGERQWTGGTATASEVRTHRFEFTPADNQVAWTSKLKGQE